MFKIVIGVVIGIIIIGLAMFNNLFGSNVKPQDGEGSIYDFKINSLSGEPVDFNKFRGKKMLIVNTASKCRYTPQYAGLEKIRERFSDRVTVLGFPANNFLWQEPGSNDDIAEFCERNYGVDFQMFEKISVKGKDMHPLYRWLQAKSGKSPSWNFCKYLIDEKGEVVGFYDAKVEPLDAKIISKINN